MPLLSEIAAVESADEIVRSIVVDTDDITPPKGVREAFVIGAFEKGDVADAVLDLAISWTLAGIAVTIEIPAAAEIEPKKLIATSAATNVSLALLPPEKGCSDEVFEAYVVRVEEFTRLYVARQNMGAALAPVTSYLGYLLTEIYHPPSVENFVPTDPYVLEVFHHAVEIERSDAMKARIRSIFHAAHGGEEGFRNFALALAGAIYRQVEETCREEVASRQQADAATGAAPEEA